MPKFIVLSVVALCAAVAADHPALGGTWVLDPAHSDTSKSKITSETLAIDQAGVGEAFRDRDRGQWKGPPHPRFPATPPAHRARSRTTVPRRLVPRRFRSGITAACW
jgi:hypothetical protein